MKRMGVREVKDHWSEILEQVETQGEVIEVTRHGQPVARLVPVPPAGPIDRDTNGTWTALNKLAEQLRSHAPRGMTTRDIMDDVRGGG